jgi:hypothetical protein
MPVREVTSRTILTMAGLVPVEAYSCLVVVALWACLPRRHQGHLRQALHEHTHTHMYTQNFESVIGTCSKPFTSHRPGSRAHRPHSECTCWQGAHPPLNATESSLTGIMPIASMPPIPPICCARASASHCACPLGCGRLSSCCPCAKLQRSPYGHEPVLTNFVHRRVLRFHGAPDDRSLPAREPLRRSSNMIIFHATHHGQSRVPRLRQQTHIGARLLCRARWHADHHKEGGPSGSAPWSGFALLLLSLVLLALVLMLLHLELILRVSLALVLILLIRLCAGAAARTGRAERPALRGGRRGRRGCSTRPELFTTVRKIAAVAKGALAMLLPLHAKARLVVAGPAIVGNLQRTTDTPKSSAHMRTGLRGTPAPQHCHTCSAGLRHLHKVPWRGHRPTQRAEGPRPSPRGPPSPRRGTRHPDRPRALQTPLPAHIPPHTPPVSFRQSAAASGGRKVGGPAHGPRRARGPTWQAGRGGRRDGHLLLRRRRLGGR